MDKEKLLYILDVKNEGKALDNNLKGLLWLDVFLFVIVACAILALKNTLISVLDIIALSLIALLTAFFCLRVKKANALEKSAVYMPLLLLKTALQLFYGYLVASKIELGIYGYAIFSWVHATVAAVALFGVACVAVSYVKLYNDVTKMSLVELTDRETKTRIEARKLLKKHPWISILPVLLPSPYIASKLFDIWSVNRGLGMSFGFFALFCLFAVLCSLCFPKFIIFLKYKTENSFKS